MGTARNNRKVGDFGKVQQQINQSLSQADSTREQKQYDWMIIDVCGPKGFGKCKNLSKKTSKFKTSSYYHYRLINLKTGKQIDGVLAGDCPRIIEDECGFTKAGFIGKICSIVYNGIGDKENGLAYIKTLSQSSLKKYEPGRVRNKMKESIKYTLHGLWEPIQNAGEQLKALLDDWDE